MTTLKVSAYAAILIALPVHPLPGLRLRAARAQPAEKRVDPPVPAHDPVPVHRRGRLRLLRRRPRRAEFLLNFNDDEFNIEVRAREYYSFFVLTLIAVGLLFQIPVGILAVTRLGIVTPEQLAENRRYADPRDRRRRDAPPGHRPGDDADLDGPAAPAVRGQPAPRAALRPPARSRARTPSRGRPARPSRSPELVSAPMLFDLQSGKRRRVVQVVFGVLALIFAISFVGFGIGSGAGSAGSSTRSASAAATARPSPQFEQADRGRRGARSRTNPTNDRRRCSIWSPTLRRRRPRSGVDDRPATGATEVTRRSRPARGRRSPPGSDYLKTKPKQPDVRGRDTRRRLYALPRSTPDGARPRRSRSSPRPEPERRTYGQLALYCTPMAS